MDEARRSEQFVPMKIFAERLKGRAAVLGLSNAEVARRIGLSERRYGHYVSGGREPDLATLVRIARVLGTSPNHLLGFDDEESKSSKRSRLTDRLIAAAKMANDVELEIFVIQTEAVTTRRSSATAGRRQSS